MILDEIVEAKRGEIAAAKQRLPFEELMRRVHGRVVERDFLGALRSPRTPPALIAELKRQSPSKGMLRERFDPVNLAQQLQDAGASALSVLTDERFFGGHLEFLREVHGFTDVPILRKDFILEPYQVYEAASAQADAILLIVQILTDAQLSALVTLAGQLGMGALVEVHSEAELKRAVRAGATAIGLNHRDLRTFAMDDTLTARLVPKIPAGKIIVAESGLQTAEDVKRMKALGVHAVLIGEALMTAPDPAAKIRELFSAVWRM